MRAPAEMARRNAERATAWPYSQRPLARLRNRAEARQQQAPAARPLLAKPFHQKYAPAQARPAARADLGCTP